MKRNDTGNSPASSYLNTYIAPNRPRLVATTFLSLVLLDVFPIKKDFFSFSLSPRDRVIAGIYF